MISIRKALAAFIVPLISILLAILIGAIIMAVLGANPLVAMNALVMGAFGTKAGIGTTLTKATQPFQTRSPGEMKRLPRCWAENRP